MEANQITQMVKRKLYDDVYVLVYEKVKNQVLESMKHLEDIYQYYINAPIKLKSRVILLGKKEEIIYQAAAAIANMRKNLVTQDDAYELDLDDLDLNALESGNWEKYLILEEDFFQAEEISETKIQSIMMGQKSKQESQLMMLKQAKNVFVEYKNGIPQKVFLEKLEQIMAENIVIWMPDVHFDRDLVKRLQFEQEFALLKVGEPDRAYYERLLEGYLTENGYQLSGELTACKLLNSLWEFRGVYFCERDIFIYADRAMAQADFRKTLFLQESDFALPSCKENSSKEILEQMVGLEQVKKQIRNLCAMRIVQSSAQENGFTKMPSHTNLAFVGPPGTGKSESARLYSKILEENHVVNGRFVEAKKGDLVGKYVGHTAPKIAKLFERADGGILFIDEAGTLTSTDDFTKEAITELVRHMEENPQTTVIFATYPDKMQEIFEQDPGLYSRISKVIPFESYTNEELCKIFAHMSKQYGYEVEKGWEKMVSQYVEHFKKLEKEKFGNAREMRKLLEAAIANCNVRILFDEKELSKAVRFITREDLREAVKELLPPKATVQRIGFVPQTQ